MKGELDRPRKEMRGEMDRMRKEMMEEIDRLKEELDWMRGEMKEKVDRLGEELEEELGSQEEMRRMSFRVEEGLEVEDNEETGVVVVVRCWFCWILNLGSDRRKVSNCLSGVWLTVGKPRGRALIQQQRTTVATRSWTELCVLCTRWRIHWRGVTGEYRKYGDHGTNNMEDDGDRVERGWVIRGEMADCADGLRSPEQSGTSRDQYHVCQCASSTCCKYYCG